MESKSLAELLERRQKPAEVQAIGQAADSPTAVIAAATATEGEAFEEPEEGSADAEKLTRGSSTGGMETKSLASLLQRRSADALGKHAAPVAHDETGPAATVSGPSPSRKEPSKVKVGALERIERIKTLLAKTELGAAPPAPVARAYEVEKVSTEGTEEESQGRDALLVVKPRSRRTRRETTASSSGPTATPSISSEVDPAGSASSSQLTTRSASISSVAALEEPPPPRAAFSTMPAMEAAAPRQDVTVSSPGR
jgi:hypothetical protein